ncbi:Pentatricopeptide repeat-containing protein [Thalictrum thalictroides]|uniref:Pentatricopeptide repeat-containing protein n=1 Tax=Thalictrum thalictroides TaxID=46969 RepID=A0A7J6X7A7_THATH|nr:Pentatricopeptide repeat-containing protein [Thalictrum thalictroides]
MHLHGFMPNEHCFTFLFAACASLSSPLQGQKIHAHFVKLGFQVDPFAVTALVDMYAKCGLVSLARKVFDEMNEKDVPAWNSMISGYAKHGDLVEARELFELMPCRNVVSWTTMISGYSQNRRYEDALEMYIRMEEDKIVKPNEVTLASVLPACANLGALEMGERIETLVREKGFAKNLFVSNALLEMYAKCGKIERAGRVFEEIGWARNLCSWNTMIMGLAVHGRWETGLELFHEMLNQGTSPDDITFVGVLLACTHGGLVEQGKRFFESMQEDFSITPKLQHYGCMVDLLGRAGLLNEAYAMINKMPMQPDSVVWGALLGACSFYHNVELAEKAAEFLFKLEPGNPGNYVILSNVYASTGRWDGVARVRKFMKGNQVTKAVGYSFIEVDGIIHKFFVEGQSHPRSDEVYALLDEISAKMKLIGSVSI